MERNFTNENFERFLKQNADGLRMRPSDKVWQGISSQLNKRRRRIGWMLGLSLLITSGLGYYFVSEQAGHTTTQHPVQPAASQNTGSDIGSNKNALPLALNSVAGAGMTVTAGRGSRFTARQGAMQIASSAISEETALSPETVDPTMPAENGFVPTVADAYPGTVSNNTQAPVTQSALPPDPMTIESVLNSFKRKDHKLGLQLYFTPTISYRKLSANKSYLNTAPPGTPGYDPYKDDVNSAVTHKPDFGFEIGLAAKYPVSKQVKLKAGLQFNVNRYEIKTYNTSTELATIKMRNGVDSVNAVTNYNNFTGYKSNWLRNFYFQVSAPVGIELKLKGDEKTEFGIATTIQPTYILGDRVYLISTDYKNYAEVPQLIRRWNVNTSLETYVSYSTGHLKWQVGPQVRYQLLSSFVKKYPVKENLFDFGLRVGISLNKQ